MRRLSVPAAIVVALALVLSAQVALGHQAGVTTVIETRFQAADPPAQAEVLQVVLDFAPDAWTPVHVHGGPVYVTVLEGEMTLRMGESTEKFGAGEGWIDSPDDPHAAGNEGPAPARLVASFVLPKGATPTTIVGTGTQAILPPGPTTVAQFSVDTLDLPSPLDVVHRVTDVAPGATVPMHTHPGPNVAMLLAGEVMLQMAGMTHEYKAGDAWVEPTNAVHGGTATGSGPTRLVTTTLAPRGAPVSTLAQP